MKRISFVPLIVSLGIAYSAGFIGSLFTAPAIDTWYDSLLTSRVNPPDWVFGPVWTLLYTLIGVAAYLVYVSAAQRKAKIRAYSIYAAQLVLNASWSIVFFGLQSPGYAFLIILLLLGTIILNGIVFYRLVRVSGLLFIPYVMWVLFASYLNLAIFILNR